MNNDTPAREINEMAGYEHFNKHNRKYIKTLQKRLNHLQDPIAKSPIDLSYDKQEAAALAWVLSYIAG